MKCLTHRLARWLLAALLLTTACSQRPTTGSAQLFGSLSQAASAEDVSRVEVTISAADMPTRTEALTKADGAWGGTLGDIPAGTDRTFTAEAFDSAGTKRFSGQATHVTITAGTTTVVALSLQSLDSPTPFDNAAPLIDSLTASTSTVSPGGALQVEATAHDPNPGDTLSYAWTASAGAFYSPYSPTSTWAAPSTPGLVTLTLTVTDPKGSSASISFTIQVQSGSGSASVDLSFNTSPGVTGITASPSLVSAGETTTVAATATDGDGDALSYQWAAGCAGSWTDAASATARFTPGTAPTGTTCADCPLTVTVTDGHGGQTTGTLHICVGPKTGVRLPPRIDSTYQSARTVPASGTVAFRVTASDPLGSALSFSWTASTGTLGSATNSASRSELTWAPPACVPADSTPSITATVTNAQGLSTSTTFSVTGGTACSGTSGGWVRTSSLSVPRVVGHTATLLPSGKVLVAAGVHMGMGLLDTSELYDPATGTWAPPSQMAMRRMDHTATLLPSGKVLVAGGLVVSGDPSDLGSPSATAELYDPATDTWTATGSMLSPHRYHTATRLPSGKVLVAGGDGNTAELYDPATGTWTTTGAMNTSRSKHTATRLPSGKVLVAGGTTSTGASPATEELYDPATGTWTPTGAMASTHSSHTATLLPSGKVLVAGGGTPHAELYDPATGTWTPTGAMGTARDGHTATLLQTGKVLVVGTQSNNTELYDPATGTWASIPSTTAFMYRSTATLLPSGKVLVVGVDVVDSTGFAELYDPVLNTGSPVGGMASKHSHHTATLLPSGKVLVAGGNGTNSAELYDPATRTWVPTGAMSTPREYHTATLLLTGKVLVAGGSGDNSVELYDPATGTWASTGAMSIPRTYHTATLLPSGRVLVEGGGDSSAELYDPATGTWSPTGGKSAYHAAPHTATLLPSGKVLVAGGDDNSAELYDPATGTWSPTGSMTVGRLFHTATLLPSGKVLVVGSVWGDNSAELYDPATGTWAPAANMTFFRGFHTATLLPSGKVLVAGGNAPYGPPRPVLEAYDPATGTWEVVGTMLSVRWAHTATLLPSGQLLLTGGNGYLANFTPAELFSL
ncbi:kelch repeat-containing protein [Archangium sp.]|uniref:kelch repeat-containing protein n=1 Tax=Archangium sp. TaxID=1872627 RepID=UPI00389AD562